MNRNLTNLFQSIIQKMGLIRTGKLYRSVQVNTYLEDNTLIIDIECEDYAMYLDDDYRLLRQFEDSPVFTEEVTALFAPWLESRVVEVLNGSPISYTDPSVIVLLNGR